MSFKNTFETQAKEYLGIQGGANGGGTVFTTANVQVGESQGLHVQLGAVPNLSYVDFRSNPATSVDFDGRIVSIGGSTGLAQGELLVQTGLFNIGAPMKIGGASFKLDYGSVVMPGTLNAQVPVVFTVGLFTVAPNVYLTVVSPITNEANAQPVFVESLTTSGFNAQFIGVPNSTAPGTLCNWLALGV